MCLCVTSNFPCIPQDPLSNLRAEKYHDYIIVILYKKGADTVRYSADICPMTGRYNMLWCRQINMV